jgi:hypothetical protein
MTVLISDKAQCQAMIDMVADWQASDTVTDTHRIIDFAFYQINQLLLPRIDPTDIAGQQELIDTVQSYYHYYTENPGTSILQYVDIETIDPIVLNILIHHIELMCFRRLNLNFDLYKSVVNPRYESLYPTFALALRGNMPDETGKMLTKVSDRFSNSTT